MVRAEEKETVFYVICLQFKKAMREWERARLSADNGKAQSTAKRLHLELQDYIMEHTEHGYIK